MKEIKEVKDMIEQDKEKALEHHLDQWLFIGLAQEGVMLHPGDNPHKKEDIIDNNFDGDIA